MLIPDNALCHKSAAVNKFLESMGDKIVLLFLPPYTPQMNLTEVRWRMVRNAIAGLYPGTKEEFQGLLEWMVKDGTLPKVAMPKWLTSCLAAAS